MKETEEFKRYAKAIANHPDPDSLDITEIGWKDLEERGYINPRRTKS